MQQSRDTNVRIPVWGFLLPEFLHQPTHIITDFMVQDFRIVLRCPYVFMTKHIGYSFYRYTVTKGNGCCKGVAGNMESKPFMNPA